MAAQRMEPYHEAEMIALEQEEGRLRCEECGEIIYDGYFIPRYDAAICESCMKEYRVRNREW